MNVKTGKNKLPLLQHFLPGTAKMGCYSLPSEPPCGGGIITIFLWTNRCHRQVAELGFKVPGHLTKVWVYFLYSTLPGIRDIEAELQSSQVLLLHQQHLV